MDHYQPQHPLPAEVQNMERDETVCKFCGVSYLIHNEIKALEDKLRLAEEELVKLRGCEKREEELSKQIKILQETNEKNKIHSAAQESTIEHMLSDIKKKEEELHRTGIQMASLQAELATAHDSIKNLKMHQQNLIKMLPKMASSLSEQKSAIQDLRDSVHKGVQHSKDISAKSYEIISGICTKSQKDLLDEQNKYHQLHEKLQMLEKRIADGERALSDQRQQHVEELATATTKLQKQLSNMKREAECADARERTATMQADQLKDQFRKLNADNDQLQTRLRAAESSTQTAISRLEQSLDEKKNALLESERSLVSLRKQLQQLESDANRKASMTKEHSEELSEVLTRTRGDLLAMQKEREMLISAHQDQIEQLRESFKTRILEAEKWPEKLEASLISEREKHSKEMEALENGLKQNFVMELQIEKQKHTDMLQKYRKQIQEAENKVNETQTKLNGHESEMHAALAEYKARARETENTLRSEIDSLKTIILDLQNRLGKVGTGVDSRVVELKSQLVTAQAESAENKELKHRLETQLENARQEIIHLQETVRHECEERFELTEALSSAREQLLDFKKPPGGYSATAHKSPSAPVGRSNTQSVNSNSGSASFSTAPPSAQINNYTNSPSPNAPSKRITSPKGRRQSEELAIYRRSKPRPPPVPTGPPSESNVNYNGNTSVPPTKGMKGSTLGDSRSRINQAMGRR